MNASKPEPQNPQAQSPKAPAKQISQQPEATPKPRRAHSGQNGTPGDQSKR